MKLVQIILTAILVLNFVPSSFAKNKTKTLPHSPPSLLFVQSISSGESEGNTLTIIEENPLVLYFSDRPNRFTGHMTGKKFLKLWQDGQDSFKKNPPNAVLSILSDDSTKNIVVELLSPVVSGKKWKYNIRKLSGNMPKSFKAASLFIDAFPTAVNNQITDSVTQANTKVLGDAPATAMGNFMIATSQALSNAAHNATIAQQQTNVTAQAATTMGVSTLYSIDTAATGKATKEIFK